MMTTRAASVLERKHLRREYVGGRVRGLRLERNFRPHGGRSKDASTRMAVIARDCPHRARGTITRYEPNWKPARRPRSNGFDDLHTPDGVLLPPRIAPARQCRAVNSRVNATIPIRSYQHSWGSIELDTAPLDGLGNISASAFHQRFSSQPEGNFLNGWRSGDSSGN